MADNSELPGGDPASAWRGFDRLALVAGLLAGVILLAFAAELIRRDWRAGAEEYADRIALGIQEQLREYSALLDFSSTLFDPTLDAPLSDFRRYWAADVLATRYPAVRSISFARRVSSEELPEYERSQLRQLRFDPGGLPLVRLRPDGAADMHHMLEQSVPDDALVDLLGIDLASDPVLLWYLSDSTGPRALVTASRLFPEAARYPLLLAPVNHPGIAPRSGVRSVPAASMSPVGHLILRVDFGLLISQALGELRPGAILELTFLQGGDPAASVASPSALYRSPGEPAADPGAPRWNSYQSLRPLSFGSTRLQLAVSRPVSLDPGYIALAGFAVLSAVLLSVLIFLVAGRVRRERDAAMRAARESTETALSLQQRFQDLVESTGDWIWETDAQGRFTYVSPNTFDLLGHAPAGLIGQPMSGLVIGQSSRADPESGVAGLVSYSLEERTVRRADGGAVVFESSATLIRRDGVIVGMRGIDRDVTRRREYRDRLAALQVQLADATRSNLVSQLLAGVAHEINQPLASIALYNEASIRLLESGRASREEIIAAMKSSAESALLAGAVIKRLRALTASRRIETLRTDVGDLARSAAALIEVRLREQGIRFNLSLNPEALLAEVDSVLMVQVLVNLLNNAIDAVAESVRPSIELRIRPREGGGIRISVIDNGSGVPSGQEEAIFESRFTTKAHGMGLGLAISRSIIEAHGGTLNVHRADDGRTEFEVRLPA